jgi:hypothetical protein
MILQRRGETRKRFSFGDFSAAFFLQNLEKPLYECSAASESKRWTADVEEPELYISDILGAISSSKATHAAAMRLCMFIAALTKGRKPRSSH